ncbi:MAG: tRNA (adenosine(37)-N6)-threonylcarbamoyltransferase complex ATPase subunit type 1 TsaE [Bacteroidota bacterium]
MQFTCTELNQLPDAARALIAAHPDARLFAFSGKMGAGKTTLIKVLCETLGVEGNTSSPTFTIVNVYKSSVHGEIFHFDFYRIKDIREIFDIGYEEYFYSGNYCFIEWPEKTTELLPPETVSVTIDVDENSGNRLIHF